MNARQTVDYYGVQPRFVGETVVQINVPSGRLIASDDLRGSPYFEVEPQFSINSGAGLDSWTKNFAEQAQVAQAFVGNSCPSIMRQEDGSLIVVSPGYDEATDEDDLVGNEVSVATICTDVWSTMLTDYSHWLRHGGPDVDEANAPYALTAFTVIDVAPGLYRWTVFSNSDDFEIHRSGRVEYAKLELIVPAKGAAE